MDGISDFEEKAPNLLKTSKDFRVKKIFGVITSEVYSLSGQRFGRTEVRGAVTTVSAFDYMISIIALAVATSVGLPKASLSGKGKTYIVKDEVGGATTTNITIRVEGEQTIEGAQSTTISTNFGSKQFYSNGEMWLVF
jgi:hypothetical protein